MCAFTAISPFHAFEAPFSHQRSRFPSLTSRSPPPNSTSCPAARFSMTASTGAATGNANNSLNMESPNEEWEQRKAERRSLSKVDIVPFEEMLTSTNGLYRRSISTIQINIGLTCNLACRHCHVESSPSRTETMSLATADRIIELVERNLSEIKTIDITGGAPEMHDQFQYLISRLHALSGGQLQIIDRCNLAILHQFPSLLGFLAQHNVKVIASLPCYTKDNVEAQRGDGVFQSSISALQLLNSVGYGREPHLSLDLVYNPVGPTLPPDQASLENDYKLRLKQDFDVDFDHLICITNMPIKRFADDLLLKKVGNDDQHSNSNGLQKYMDLLVSSFNQDTVDNVMCLDMVHVSWNGVINDCDFNYALDMPTANMHSDSKRALTIFDIESFNDIAHQRITTGKHCYGCTAGKGSSCGGVLT